MATKTNKIVLFSSKSNKRTVEKLKKSIKKRLLILTLIASLLVGMYCTAMFSNIPGIKKWRNLYIETAMDTLSHKWLATFFIPKSVIDGVMANKAAVLEAQQELESSWAPLESTTAPSASLEPEPESDKALKVFLELYYELDETSFNDYITKNPKLIKNGYDQLLINEAGLDDDGTPIYTTNGDQVLALDAENGLLIVKVEGEGYVGKLAIVKDPSTVKLGVSKSLGSYGQTVQKIADNNNAVLAINASGFADDERVGNGGVVVGLLIADGKMLNKPVNSPYLTIGFSEDDRLNIGVSVNKLKYRDAIEFVPALIINGVEVIKDKKLVDGSMGFGLQPRTVIGQTEDGTVLLMTIDGRQVGYSIGCTVVECADILMEYGAYQASNVDGGSSTVMYYRGEYITKPANGIEYGRYVPDAFIVEYTGEPEPAEN